MPKPRKIPTVRQPEVVPALSVRFVNRQPLPVEVRADWIQELGRSSAAKIKRKFMRGMITYGTDIGERDIIYLLDAIEEEALDTLGYVAELRRRCQHNHKL